MGTTTSNTGNERLDVLTVQKLSLAGVLCVWVFTGCVNQNTWKPAIDPYNDPKGYRLGIDESECRQIAQQNAGGSIQETGKGAILGGLLGAAAGAAIGAVTGSPGQGAAIGAVTGGFGGGAISGAQSGGTFQEVFKNCMRARGHTVLN